ncbi:MAG: pyrimidine dimer DNA glycosylase/endonuclease V [Candidatus Omnitrophota bacterium]
MRLWSIHPRYLDRQGLLALWRESLLAQRVLEGKTKGYKRHPQLERFRRQGRPLGRIGFYLEYVRREALKRGYCFSIDKIGNFSRVPHSIEVKRGQLLFEFRHLMGKLKKRDPGLYRLLLKTRKIQAHPLFRVTSGGKEEWERG